MLDGLRVKTSVLGGSLLALAVSSTLAADLPSVKAPPLPIWTGFYAGLNAGYDWGTTANATTRSAPLFDVVALTANGLDPAHVVAGGLINGGTALANSGTAKVSQTGFIGGGQIGYNYQWSPTFLAGLEADIQGTSVRGSGNYAGAFQDSIQWNDGPGAHPCGPTINCVLVRTASGAGRVSANTDWLGTVRGRLGYLVSPTVLVYGTGGLAYGGVSASATNSAIIQGSIANLNPPFAGFNGVVNLPTLPGSGHYSSTRVGWAAGGGFEWMFAPNWSLKAEGLYYDLGKATFASSPIVAASPVTIAVPPFLAVNAGQPLIANRPTTRVAYDGVVLRAGVSYHF
jgi:outer membrane immunogenic protein